MSDGNDQGFELALAYDGAVIPRYARHFGERLLGTMRFGPKPNVLDLACRTGYPAVKVLETARDGRIIALDRDGKFLELARARLGVDVGRKVFLKQGGATALRFGADVFTHVACNLIDRVAEERTAILSEALRVLLPGGQVAFTLALQGSFAEPLDLLREVATRYDLARVSERVEQLTAKMPTAEQVRGELAAQGFVASHVESWGFTLDYGSSHELFHDPVIQHAAFADWRWCAEAAPDPDAVLASLRGAFDTYFAGRGFSVGVVGGVATGFKPA